MRGYRHRCRLDVAIDAFGAQFTAVAAGLTPPSGANGPIG